LEPESRTLNECHSKLSAGHGVHFWLRYFWIFYFLSPEAGYDSPLAEGPGWFAVKSKLKNLCH
jgi:hypothetical protein